MLITGDSTRLLVTHLLVMTAHARPCQEGGDFELCFLTKASLNEEDIYPDIREQFTRESEIRERRKYEFAVRTREMRGIPEEYLKNCTVCEEDSEDVVDREDHVTQYLSELLVNTDSEITSLQASDVEEIREESASGGKDDGYFAFLTGNELKFEVDGVWSHPAKTIVDDSELAR